MTATSVYKLLKSLGVKFTHDPEGFLLAPDRDGKRWRIRRGSGIAGRGDYWSLMSLRAGGGASRFVGTKRELRDVLGEYLAGPRPLERLGHIQYVRWCAGGYAWCYRKQRGPSALDADCPKEPGH